MKSKLQTDAQTEQAQAGSVQRLVSPRSCKCVRGIGLNGAELGYVKDCPIHGEGTRYWNNPDYGIAYDCEAD